ncbi:MAG: anthranilate phosphoribosyltransferase [Desulfobacteraceae bacterium]|nr:anthranilate phosphoribosyltransferase [Desulfobacteraceae bacterium]
MLTRTDRAFGTLISRLINKEDLSRDEAKNAFCRMLGDETSEMQQGALLAALTAKGETEDEVAGAWEAIYEMDTHTVSLAGDTPVVENSGTGMDTFKTFNISTAASIIAASGDIRMARHGARAITSACGTVDMAEALGVDVECSARVVADSIEKANIGLFNGMSPQIHPNALGRILSKICFGSTLNIAASLANPALPKRAVRGVYARRMVAPVARVMKAIGYERAVVLHGGIDNSTKGMDEASVSGTTYCAELCSDGRIREFEFLPSDFGLDTHDPDLLAPTSEINTEARRFTSLITGKPIDARADAAALNAGLIFYVADRTGSIGDGVSAARDALRSGEAFTALENWVATQNTDPEKGLRTLHTLC